MRTVKQIREELYWAQDNGLTNDQIEALETEMLEVETSECEVFVESEKSTEVTERELILQVRECIPYLSRNSNKAYLATTWFIELTREKQLLAVKNFKEIYKKNTAEKFRLNTVK